MYRPCLICGALTEGARCPEHRAELRAKYADGWPIISRAAIAQHVAQHGQWCPGWGVDPHDSDDLTLDHQRGVMCRSCNARKRRTDGE